MASLRGRLERALDALRALLNALCSTRSAKRFERDTLARVQAALRTDRATNVDATEPHFCRASCHTRAKTINTNQVASPRT
jgi:hypothetical protein